ncbi:MAG: class I SAM-dependent methyltransferase [Candidatus Binatia bacterium]
MMEEARALREMSPGDAVRDVAAEPCRICGGGLRPAFHGTLLGDVPVTYYLCRDCHSLLLPHPWWLARAYTSVPVPDPDYGLVQRTLFVQATLRRMRFVGLLPQACRSLDHGAGRGLLVQLLLDHGYDAWGYDPISTPCFAEGRIARELPAGRFDLITSIEVSEHLLDPVGVLSHLRSLLAPKGLLVLSTELFDEHQHDASWSYLAQEHGQHVTLFSRSGLHRAAERAGLKWVWSLRFAGIDFLHLLVHRDSRLPAWRLWHLRLRQSRGKRRARRDGSA